MVEEVILVNEYDQEVGVEEKHRAHEMGLCHRAFSVFIFRRIKEKIELLIQQRNPAKYHSGGLWTNTCCGHPRPGEDTLQAAQRRLREEMGFSVPLIEVGFFHYVASFNNLISENEMDHVFVGFNQEHTINPNEKEVVAIEWIEFKTLQKMLFEHPERYTAWLLKALSLAKKALEEGLL